MIYTVTFNPALDYVISVDHFTPGKINRTVSENMICGGKGINVSALLANLGYESTALGFVAGFTGVEIEKRAKELGFASDFIHVKKGMSRINVKMKSDEETEINGMGPDIQQEDVDALFEKLDGLKEGDVLVLSGSIPSMISHHIYEEIMKRLEDRGVRMVVDAEKDLLLDVLPLKPFLIKPNNHELGEIFGVNLSTKESVVPYAKKLQEKGARNVLISMAGEGAVLVSEDKSVFMAEAPKGTLINGVGAGDSMVAGFLAGWMKSHDYKEAFRMGVACGSASAFSEYLADSEMIEKVYNQVQVNECK